MIIAVSAGHPLEDLCLSLLLYPSVAMQMELSTRPDTMQGEKKMKVNSAYACSMDSLPHVEIRTEI